MRVCVCAGVSLILLGGLSSAALAAADPAAKEFLSS